MPSATQNHRKCPFCAEEIKADAIKCKHCRADLRDSPESSETQAKTVMSEGKGNTLKRVSFIKGLGASILFGIVAIGLGGLLTVTVIGGIIGIPMIFIGGIAILLSPFMFLAMSEGNCPYCQHQAIVMNGKKVVKCRSCKKRFSIRDGALYRIPT
jgi:ribosomal protein L37AE/L43A